MAIDLHRLHVIVTLGIKAHRVRILIRQLVQKADRRVELVYKPAEARIQRDRLDCGLTFQLANRVLIQKFTGAPQNNTLCWPRFGLMEP